ncbi:hypothetical protein GCM10010116_24440 [Microbispora rosea subsp. aerata]|nr:hypothetical protein [Microbispora rosea]GGO12190.1 hypothetical protein GCM10010116_24440 [Microbispora rosea subsp. aerata]GIH58603.1 hypothetical protein Mro02_55170 [Microbispora rosea subsp. aerata]GLJ84715.1 hypothetical protein GCM10017588_34430 [Microbispora rosea subsp. aerata]
MGLMPPAWAQPVANLVNFPKIDEAEILAEVRPWQVVRAGAASGGSGAEDQVRRLPGVYQGTSADAMHDNWTKTGTPGHLRSAVQAAAYAPAVLEGTASAVTATKVAVITQAVAGATRLASVLVAGGPFAVASATAGLLATRYAMRKILREAEEGGARVLAPAITRHVTEPLERILRNTRGPFGGGPSLAGAGGPGVPLRSTPVRTAGDAGPRGGVKLDMGRSRKPYAKQTGPELTAAEKAALDAKKHGQPYDRKIAKAAEQKEKTREKLEGQRNAQKRGTQVNPGGSNQQNQQSQGSQGKKKKRFW